ncbi:MAG TPA: DoxX family protein [Stellaceae bacterium]|nr:DoxX family protein [Stellaceae bacterium]
MSNGVDAKRLYVPGLAGLYGRFSPYSYAVMRFATGAVLLPHGIQKVVEGRIPGLETVIAGKLPAGLAFGWFAWLLTCMAVFAETIAAAFLAIGLFTRLMALVIVIEMAVIIAVFQWQFGYFWTNRGYEYALLWLVLCLAIMFRGGGEHSVDARLTREF